MKCKICGMNINEKNYDFNSFAFLNINSIDNIVYCPFCGVSSIYLSNSDKVIEVDSKNLDENTLKILDHAVKLEIFNGEFYKEAAKTAKSEKISKAFQALSKIEIFHSKVHMGLGGFTKTPTLSKINYDKYDSDEALLKLAKEREEHAVYYYERYKNEVCDENVKKVFEALIEVEKDHIDLTYEYRGIN
ncbi:ferritin family protein [Clostridium sp.]|uniref:ferritin family protein n=1 Tax=Clostridium sp. TaxID=1506 RepID=UPI003217F608